MYQPLVVSTEAILDQVHETDHDLLLEIVLANMRQETLTFQKHLQKGKRDKRKELITKINELNSYINDDGYYKEAKEKEGELRRLNEEILADQAAIFKNTALLNDCKPTKEFLNMEQLKGSYCSLTKLRVEKTDVTTGKKVEKEINEPHEIRDEIKNFYQDIFNKQTVKDGDHGIEDFLKSDGDSDPYEELVKRQLTNETRDSLEGKISLHEMTKALNEDMNGTSAPGVDGSTVNFIRKFWTALGALIVNAVNTSKSKGKLTITL